LKIERECSDYNPLIREDGNFDGEERLWAFIFHVNRASERVVMKAGFVFEGRLWRAVGKNGVVMDELSYSVVREDWEKQQHEKEKM
jgi:RimJ/RimL family protein N-acetyltransferase